MKIKPSDLWRWDGTVDRGPYLVIGILLFALKHNLDRLVASVFFGRHWDLFNYLRPGNQHGVTRLTKDDLTFYSSLLVLALPFIWTGIVLTLRRLRAVRWPLCLVVIFFLPVINLLFFILLSILPSAESPQETRTDKHGREMLYRLIPDHRWGNAAMALLLTSLLGVGATLFGATVLQNYGWGLFVGMPFCMGLISVLLHGYHHQRSLGECIVVSLFSVVLLGAVLLALAVEGVVCLMMAAPIGGVLAVFGGWVGYLIQRHWENRQAIPPVILALALAIPLLMGAEYASCPEPPLFAVRTAVEINASTRQVWQHVISFPELPPPGEWLFRMGIAYPVQARIQGCGVGAERHCVFSTGAFVEPIEVWDEPRLLKFSVISNPPPMEEWTPYSNIHPPHLNGFLVSQGGQFLLLPLADGRTRLEGTTWYRHNLWPAVYWQLWSDAIIHRIHLRVLNHVKQLSEQKAGKFVSPSSQRAQFDIRLNKPFS